MDLLINRETLKRELASRGLTQNEFCRRAGVTTNTLARINKGLPIRNDTLGKIAVALSRIERLEGVAEIVHDLAEPA